MSNNKTIGRNFIERILGTGDWERASDIVDADVVMLHPSRPEPIRGFEAVKKFLSAFRAGFPDLQLVAEDAVAEGDKVLIRWNVRGTHTGNLFGIPPTGKPIHIQGMSLFRIADGKIVEDWVSEDSLGMLQQLGVVPTLG